MQGLHACHVDQSVSRPLRLQFGDDQGWAKLPLLGEALVDSQCDKTEKMTTKEMTLCMICEYLVIVAD